MDAKHSGKEFLTQMRSGSLRPSLIRIGMAKPGDADSDVILFSESETCGHWVAVPLDIVESVQVIGWMACDDHKHPIVRLQLHEPAPDNKNARVLAELLTTKDTARSPADDPQGGVRPMIGLLRQRSGYGGAATMPAWTVARTIARRGLHSCSVTRLARVFAVVVGNVASVEISGVGPGGNGPRISIGDGLARNSPPGTSGRRGLNRVRQ